MGTWLPWALLVFVAILVVAMPWGRPHPNHEFMLNMLRLIQDEDTRVAGDSLLNGRRLNTDAKHHSGSLDTHR